MAPNIMIALEDIFSILADNDSSLKNEVAQLLAKRENPEALHSAIRLLDTRDTKAKYLVAELLCRIDVQQFENELTQLLSDFNVDVRWHVCGLIYQFGNSRLASTVTKRLNDESASVRVIAADCLGRIGLRESTVYLEHAAKFDDGVCVRSFCQTRCRGGNRPDQVENQHAFVSYTAVIQLGLIKTYSAIWAACDDDAD